MQKYFDQFISLKGKNDINFLIDVFDDFPSFMITKENNVYQAINQIINKLKLIVIDEIDISSDKYFVICLSQFILTIHESDLCLIRQYFDQNKDSSIFVLKHDDNSTFLKKMIEIGLDLKNFSISHFDLTFQVDAKHFLTYFYIDKQIIYWGLIKNCFSSFIIERSYINSKIDRIKQNKELFQLISPQLNLMENDYIMFENVGLGSSSLIKKIFHIKNQKIYALKVCYDEELFERERFNYLKVQHPFLARYYGYTTFDYHKSLVIEYVEGMELSKIKKINLNKTDKFKIIFEIMIVIQYLHYNNFIYRDLKPNNILINQNKTIILIDLDRMIENIEINKDEKSTRDFSSYYIAPEIIQGENYSFSADIYSIGMMIYFIVFEKPPIIPIGKIDFPNEYSELKQIFYQCISQNINERPNISQLINSFYINCFLKIHKELIEINTFKLIKNDDNFKDFSLYLTYLAECDDSYSLYQIGKMYKKGKLFPKDINKIIHYFSLSAKLNYPKAQYFLGVFYYEGKYVEMNIEKSLHYLTSSANQNYINAHYYLGTIYYENKHVKRDITKVIQYFRYASKNFHLQAKYSLGIIYYEGKYVKRDIELAIQYFKYCAENNHHESLFFLV